MKARYVVAILSVSVFPAAASPGCSSGGKSATAGTRSGSGVDASTGVDSGGSSDASTGSDGALGPDDTDNDLPLPLAAGLAPTPPMGWNSWNAFGGSVSEQLVEEVATAMVSSGMKDAGYQYVNIDDGWTQPTRAPDGTIQVASNYPDGIQAVADYVHNLGLKFGIYSDRGTALCSCSGGNPACACQNGSQGHEAQDAMTYAAWGVDYLKYDNCCASLDVETQYQTMGSALLATGRPIVYSLCAWQFYEWGIGFANLWRTTSDIQANWASVFGNAMTTRYLAAYAGPMKYMRAPTSAGDPSTAPGVPYGWNDADMLEAGNSGLTDAENQTHFSLWAIAAAPLITGNDIRTMSARTQSILTNKEVIALNQDPLGLQAFAVRTDGSIWAKPLNESGARGVVLVNPGASDADVGVQWSEIGLRGGSAAVRDLVAHQDLGSFQDGYTVHLSSHASAALKVTGTEPARPHGTAFLSDLTWTYGANGLGTIHRDESNSSSAPATRTPISLRGTTYPKGLGTDGPSMAIFRLAQQCTTFTANVGVDDVTAGSGSVVFQVWADGEKLFDSAAVTGTSSVLSVRVDLTGKRRLILLVTNAGDGNAQDRADWANAQVVCAP
jgi:alpha-galactosidase